MKIDEYFIDILNTYIYLKPNASITQSDESVKLFLLMPES